MLSIIIPFYNAEKHMEECFDSIIAQSYRDYEVIMINDGSNDNSLEIANKYCEQDKRFKVYSKVNGGLSSARNYGLPYINGKYLTFLDSDDYLDKNTYQLMMSKIVDEDLDLVMADIQYFFEDNSNGYVLKGLNQSFEDIRSKQAMLSPMFAWNKIYKASYFLGNNKLYPDGLWYEDIPVSSSLFANTEKIGYVNHVGYYYRQSMTSIMGQRSDKMQDIFTIIKMTLDYFKEKDLYDKYYDELEYLVTEHIMLYGQFRFIVSDDYKILFKKSRKFMMESFPNYKKSKYISLLDKKNKLFINTLNNVTMVIYREYLKRK